MPIGMYPDRMAECAGTTYDSISHTPAPMQRSTHGANTRQRQLLVKTGNLNRGKAALVAGADHGVEILLDTLKNL